MCRAGSEQQEGKQSQGEGVGRKARSQQLARGSSMAYKELGFDALTKGNWLRSYPAKTRPPSSQSQPDNLPISERNPSARFAASGRPAVGEDQGEKSA